MDFESRVLPELRPVLALLPQMKLPEDLQKMCNAPIPEYEKSPHVITTTRMIAGPVGEIMVKVYEPANRPDTPLPGLLYIHGGGYVLGHPDRDDINCEITVLEVNCVVVSVDYRLAPEHPYPAAIEDCYAALKWMADSAAELSIDKKRIAVGGGSAGGGLTAAVTLMARDKGGPAICFQMPLYPMIDNRNTSPSSREITSPKAVWNRDHNIAAWKMYLGEHASGEVSPYAAPIHADNFKGLPPTYTCVGQLDPFRDETIEYVSRLVEAGVDVEFHLYPGCFHGFEVFAPEAEVSKRAGMEYMNALKRALHPAPASE
ncbi:acetyl esterase/lipase [Laceyella sacchari]|uniref:alpha/beta hydrolase n=1 Tax=Laceyella sacchari TaxID=37482 RepID=UPI001051FCA8|nr:alpha/beta hydrolase [Laceyella sacchari]TCW37839.1 acetyl esterase/lipase [Laceyella sacchari]